MPPALVSPPGRLFRSTRGLDPLVLTSWDYIRRNERGRWDDTEEEYRVLYFSDSAVGAFVEVLQDLRQNGAALAALTDIEDDGGDGDDVPTDMNTVSERLQSRYLATLLPTNPDERVVAIDHGATRSYIESRGLGTALKIGDFIGTSRALSRATSRVLFDYGARGICAPSAEHHPSLNLAAFETHSVSGRVRLNLTVMAADLALTLPDAVISAAQYLGLLTAPKPETAV
jgi:hypothetical protein